MRNAHACCNRLRWGTGLSGLAALVPLLLLVAPAAGDVSIDLSGASTGTMITGVGGSFAGIFSGQSIVGGTGISGSPSGPLTLQPANILDVESWSGENSILPTPGNQGPLSLLLDTPATSISWIMGFGNPPSDVSIDFFAADGSLVHSLNQPILVDYNTYSYGGFGTFAGLSIYNNDDPAGLRYYHFEYTPIPAPGAALLGFIGLGALGWVKRRL